MRLQLPQADQFVAQLKAGIRFDYNGAAISMLTMERKKFRKREGYSESR
jgi:hypothetical protein